MNNDRLTIIERQQARIDRRNLDLQHHIEVRTMLQVTARHYTVQEATETDWCIANQNPEWRAKVTLARLLNAHQQIREHRRTA